MRKMFLDIDKKNLQKIAVIDDTNNEISYGDIVKFINKQKKLKISRSIVMCLYDNSIDSFLGYITFQEIGLVPLLLSVNTDNQLVEDLLDTYKPKYIYLPKDRISEINYENVIFEQGNFVCLETKKEFDDIHEKLSLLLPTSGSTGSPKLVRYKYGNLESNAKNVADGLKWTSDEIGYVDLPMNYTMSLNVINVHLYLGATLVLTNNNILSKEYWNSIKSNKITNITGVPFTYELFEKLGFYKMDLPNLVNLCQGGGKMPSNRFEKLVDFSNEKKKNFIATFGTTETAARMSYLSPDIAKVKVGSIGKPFPNGDMYLIDEDGKKITTKNVKGELIFEGPNVTMGYAKKKKDLIKDDEWLGVYRTGDYATLDEEGYFYIVGRKSRFLKLLGHRVSLDQTELLIKNQFDMECACTGNDEQMKIYITNSKFKADVLTFVCETTKLYKNLFSIIVVSDIPKNESGKTMYKLLK